MGWGGLICRWRGHKFVKFNDGTKRRCRRCKQEDWLMRQAAVAAYNEAQAALSC